MNLNQPYIEVKPKAKQAANKKHDTLITSRLFCNISETTEARVQQNSTLIHDTTEHDYPDTVQQPVSESDTEVTEEYTTKFRRGSKDEETSAIKTKRTIIRKKKPYSVEADNVVVIEEELDDIRSTIPSIPRKQFMPIEEISGDSGVEEIIPSSIEEVEEIMPLEETQLDENKIDFVDITDADEKKRDSTEHTKKTKKSQVQTIEEATVIENCRDSIITSKSKILPEEIKLAEEISQTLSVTESITPSDREEVTVTEEITETGKPRKIIEKKIIRKKGQKQQVTVEQTVEEEVKTPVTTVVAQTAEEDVPEKVTEDLPIVEISKPTEVEEIREEVTVTDEITKTGKPRKVIKKKIIRKKGQKQQVTVEQTIEEEGKAPVTTVVAQTAEEDVPEEVTEDLPIVEFGQPAEREEVREEVTVTEEISETGKPRKIIKKKIIRKRDQKQQVTVEQTVEEEGKAPVATLVAQTTEEDIPEDVTEHLPIVEISEPTEREEVREEVTVTEEIAGTGQPRKVVKKKVIRKKGQKQQITVEQTVEEESKAPVTTVIAESAEEDVPKEDTEDLPIVKFGEPTEREEIREELTVTEEITKMGKPGKVIEKKIIRKKGKKQQITVEQTVEEEGGAPVTTVIAYLTEEDVLEKVPEHLPFVAFGQPTEYDKIHEEVTIIDDTTKKETLRNVIEKEEVRKVGKQQQVMGEKIVEEDGKVPVVSVTKLPVEEVNDIPDAKKEAKESKPRKPQNDNPEDLALLKAKLKPQRVDVTITDMKPTQLKISKAEEEKPQFAQIRLKKAPIAKRKDGKKDKFPNVLLRSRVTFFEWPPAIRRPKITFLKPQFVQNGILSHTMDEALKLKKIKQKKFKPLHHDLVDLEKLDAEFHDVKKIPLEEMPEKTPYERKAKPKKPEKKTDKKLMIGTGQPREQEEYQPENAQLKKIPEKKPKAEDQVQPAKKPEKPMKDKQKPMDNDDSSRGLKFKPYDIEPFASVSEICEPMEGGEIPEILDQPEDKKKRNQKPKKLEQEYEEISIFSGKTKPQPEEKVSEHEYKSRQGPKPEDEHEKIKLKPWKKLSDKEDAVKPHDDSIKFVPSANEDGDVPETIETITTQEIIKKPEKKLTKITKKRIIKKKGTKQQITEVTTLEEEGAAPVCNVVEHPVEEILSDKVIPSLPSKEHGTNSIEPEEIREQVTISETITDEGKPVTVTKKRTVRRKGNKQTVIEDEVVEEEGQAPMLLHTETPSEDIIDEEIYHPMEIVDEQVPSIIEETTEQVTVTEVITKEGRPRKTTKRKIIKKKGNVHKIAEVVTVEEDGKSPQNTITEQILEDVPKSIDWEEQRKVLEEVRNEVKVAEFITPEGKPKKFTKKKKVVKRGKVEQVTEEITVEEKGKSPMTFLVQEPFESDVGEKELAELFPEIVELKDVEVTEQITVSEEVTDKGKPRTIIKKRAVKKAGKKQKVIEKITVEEEGKAPVTTVREEPVEEIILDEVTYSFPAFGQAIPSEVEEVRQQVVVIRETTHEGRQKKIVKKRVVRRKGEKQKVTEETSIEVNGEEPVTTVVEHPEESLIFEETNRPLEENKDIVPEIVTSKTTITEELTPQQKPKRITKKRTVVQKPDNKPRITEETIVEVDGQEPLMTTRDVSVEELQDILPKTIESKKVKKPKTIPIKHAEMEECLPEEIVQLPEEQAVPEYVDTVITEEILETLDKIPQRVTTIRTTRRTKGKKPIVIEEVTVEEVGKEPITTTTVEPPEGTVEVDEIVELPALEELVPPVIEVTREETMVVAESTEEGTPRKITKKRRLVKKCGEDQKIVEEVTVEEQGKEPVITISEITEDRIPKTQDYKFNIPDVKKKPKKVLNRKQKPQKTPNEVQQIEEIEEKLKPQLMKIERKEQKPIKLKLGEPQKPEFCQIKLKKSSVAKKPKDTTKSDEFPKIMLRSRIVAREWPPGIKYPVISELEPNFVQSGILSRNMEDALKLKKPKRRTTKLMKKELADLEKLDLEFEELKKIPLAPIEDKSVYERQPKPKKPEEELPQNLKIGKGKVPLKEEPEAEQISLKKVHMKDREESEEEKPIKKKKESKRERTKPKEEKEYPELRPFEPFNTQSSEVDLEELEVPELPVKEKPEKDKHVKKHPKTNKVKPTTETESVPIVPGEPKPQEAEDEQDHNFRILQRDQPDEKTDEIKLKPWKKEHKPEDNEKDRDDRIKFIPRDMDVIETVETVTTEEVQEAIGKKPKRVTKKRIVKKRGKETPRVTEEVTVEEEGEQPVTTINFEEIEVCDLPIEQPEVTEPKIVEEITETVTVTSIATEEGKPVKIHKKLIAKKRAGIEQVTGVVTVEEEGKEPVTTVIDEIEDNTPKSHEKPKHKKPKQSKDVKWGPEGEPTCHYYILPYYPYYTMITYIGLY